MDNIAESMEKRWTFYFDLKGTRQSTEITLINMFGQNAVGLDICSILESLTIYATRYDHEVDIFYSNADHALAQVCKDENTRNSILTRMLNEIIDTIRSFLVVLDYIRKNKSENYNGVGVLYLRQLDQIQLMIG